MSRVCSINNLPLLLLLFSPYPGRPFHISRFPLGMSVNAAVQRSGMDISEVTTIHQRPARIQELTWSPGGFSPNDTDPVQQVLFSFYDGQLFRMVVDYDADKIKGLTSYTSSPPFPRSMARRRDLESRSYYRPTLPKTHCKLLHVGKMPIIRAASFSSPTDRIFS
jgi:hypothetical protein